MLTRLDSCALILPMAWRSLRAGRGIMTGNAAIIALVEPFGTSASLRRTVAAIPSPGRPRVDRIRDET